MTGYPRSRGIKEALMAEGVSASPPFLLTLLPISH